MYRGAEMGLGLGFEMKVIQELLRHAWTPKEYQNFSTKCQNDHGCLWTWLDCCRWSWSGKLKPFDLLIMPYFWDQTLFILEQDRNYSSLISLAEITTQRSQIWHRASQLRLSNCWAWSTWESQVAEGNKHSKSGIIACRLILLIAR